MTREQWQQTRAAEQLLTSEIALTSEDLAGRLGLDHAAVRVILGVMYRQRRVDRCGNYVVLTPRPAVEGRRAA